ncbi:MAG: 50S ribosomal protein L31 [Candidatus Abawacabacteria bacterium RBG_16_42_10]|uniref:Large ribosomal subunit protein bL31 n=1 Tax=Candidatus Abawacabacteria bacterium RBG_16_42_10 TaxID=1817814 RepID=A0A1F4XNF5_9BACT|nr:MAG: 50S ribosomal protein L31 [Candidatus Abawacabacteria bacterium RBG_16_42_10]
MKADIHPTYYKKVIATCACGTTYELGSTMESITTEICAACHPFYTGKQKLLDTAGQVDKFLAKVKKATQTKESAKAVKEEVKPEELLENVESQAVLVETAMPGEVVVPKIEKKPATKKIAKAPKAKAPAKKTPKKVAVKKAAKKPTAKPKKVAKKTKIPVRAQNLAPRLSAKKPVVKIAKKVTKKPVKSAKKVTKKKTSKK